MSLSIEKRDIKGMALICILACALTYGVFALMSNAIEKREYEDAERTSLEWANYFDHNVTDLEAIAKGAKPSPESLRVMDQARKIGNIFRYKIFSSTGVLRLISDQLETANSGGASPGKHNHKVTKVAKTGKPLTIVKHNHDHNGPAMFSETYLPIFREGKVIAVVEVYIDLSEQHAVLMENLLISFLAPLLIIALAFAGPATAFYIRTRQREYANQQILVQQGRMNVALANMSQGLCLFDADQRLLIQNNQFSSLYNVSPSRVTPGMTLREILELRVEAGVYSGPCPKKYIEKRVKWVTHSGRKFVTEQMNDGRTIAITQETLPEGGWVATHTDITELREIEEKVELLSNYDAVTNLPNRALFGEKIEELSDQDTFAVLCIDLDNFKAITDTLGHSVGDVLLKSVADRLKNLISADDTVSKLGNDEFAIIQATPDQPEMATKLSERIISSMQQPFRIEGHEVNTNVSIGITVAPLDGSSANELIRNGDIALTRSRAEGRSKYRFFEQEMDLRMKERRQIEIDLRSALVDNELELYYQPIISVKSEQACGFEALIRWNHPERGLVPPDEFIPIAEETGLIVQIGEWVIRQACHTVSNWPERIKIAVNLSTVQFKSDKLVPTIMNALSTNGLSPDRLELEITESLFLDDSEGTLQTLLMLRSLGVRIAMDDFGTGYSSLGYLRSFPFDKIKLDRCFINDFDNENGSKSIIRAVSSMGDSLSMTTTAEGVETLEQLEFVKSEGYNEVQGYFYSKPQPLGIINERYFPERENAGMTEVA